MRPTPIVVVAAAIACKPPPEAPAEVGALTQFLFAETDGDEDSLRSAADQTYTYLATLDLDAGVNDRAVTPPALTSDFTDELVLPASFDPETQVAVALSGRSTHPIADHQPLAWETNHVCIESDTTKQYVRHILSDLTCFQDGSCDTLETTNEVRKENFLANIWYDLKKDFRTFTLEDGSTAIVARSWLETQAFTDNGNGSIDQSFQVEIWLPDPDDATATLRFGAMWSSVDLSGVGDDVWASLVKSGLDEGYANTDNFLDGGDCNNDRDIPYDREQ